MMVDVSVILLLLASLLSLLICIDGKRNTLIMIGDDYGFESQVYGNTACHTPNLDRLASRGVAFTHAFTSVSSCSPSRSAILTGLPVHQNGMYGLHDRHNHFNSFDEVHSMPTILNNASIRTGIVGKKHVGPENVYPFEYAQTEENWPLLQIGRNVTLMKEKAAEFLHNLDSRPFLLYIGFHDPHRNGSQDGDPHYYGLFAEKFGNGQPGNGVIPDWKPPTYKPEDVEVPFFLPDTPATRMDMVAYYTSIHRMDTGIGLMVQLLEEFGVLDETLILFTSDNGIPFPTAKTNLYNQGIGEPLIISSPEHKEKWGQKTDAVVSHVDILPTVLDWLGVPLPRYSILASPVHYTGQSMLPLVGTTVVRDTWDTAYASHNFHEVTMPYMMRAVRHKQYHLIHNLNFKMPFSMATDLYACPTFQGIIQSTKAGQPTNWYKNLTDYYYRPQWEMYDLDKDPKGLNNVAENEAYSSVFKMLRENLYQWQVLTGDLWRCLPNGKLEGATCMDLDNGILG